MDTASPTLMKSFLSETDTKATKRDLSFCPFPAPGLALDWPWLSNCAAKNRRAGCSPRPWWRKHPGRACARSEGEEKRRRKRSREKRKKETVFFHVQRPTLQHTCHALAMHATTYSTLRCARHNFSIVYCASNLRRRKIQLTEDGRLSVI